MKQDYLAELESISDQISQGKVRNVLLGERHSFLLGDGRERYDISEWESGDPFNTIDWQLTLPHWPDKVYKRVRIEPKQMPLVLALDASPSMLLRLDKYTNKFKVLLRATAILGFSGIKNHDPVAIATFGNPTHIFGRPSYSKGMILSSLAQLIEDSEFLQQRGRRSVPANYMAALRANECLHEISHRIRSQSVVVVVTDAIDFIYDQEKLDENILANLVHRHKENVVFLVLDDSQEFSWPRGAGSIMVKDFETGEMVEMKAGRAKKVLAEHHAKQKQFQKYLEDQGVASVVLDTQHWFDQLAEFAAHRAAS